MSLTEFTDNDINDLLRDLGDLGCWDNEEGNNTVVEREGNKIIEDIDVKETWGWCAMDETAMVIPVNQENYQTEFQQQDSPVFGRPLHDSYSSERPRRRNGKKLIRSRPLSQINSNVPQNGKYRTRPCKAWSYSRRCQYGSRCVFTHSNDNIGRHHHQNQNQNQSHTTHDDEIEAQPSTQNYNKGTNKGEPFVDQSGCFWFGDMP